MGKYDDLCAHASTDAGRAECWPCRHYQREATGPHEWLHQCDLLAVTFPRRCRRYEREPGSDDHLGELTQLGQAMGGYGLDGEGV